MTSGGVLGWRMGSATPSRICLKLALRSCFSSVPPWMPTRRARWRRFSRTIAVVAEPMSAARRTGSRSVRVDSSTSRVRAMTELMDSEKDSRVRVTACSCRRSRAWPPAGLALEWAGRIAARIFRVCRRGRRPCWSSLADYKDRYMQSMSGMSHWPRLFVAAGPGHEFADGVPGVLVVVEDGVHLLGDGHLDAVARGQTKGGCGAADAFGYLAVETGEDVIELGGLCRVRSLRTGCARASRCR